MNESRARTWAAGLTLLLLGTLGAFAIGRKAADFLLLPTALTWEGRPEVPGLVGHELEDARERAEEAGTALDVLGYAYGAEVDSGEVLVQYPPEGLALEQGKPIEVLVGAGPGRRRVPDLAGFPEASALALLVTAGIPVAGTRNVAEGGFEKGAIVSTEPPAGSLLGPGDSILLAVSHGGGIVEVPDVIGKSEAEAATVLREAHLVPGKVTSAQGGSTQGKSAGGEESEAGRGTVVAQDPPAGGLARSGSAVNLQLDRKPPSETEEPPAEEEE